MAEAADGVYFAARLAVMERRVRRLVERRRKQDPHPDDAFRGLYLADVEVDAILATDTQSRGLTADDDDERLYGAAEARADAVEAGGLHLRLRTLAEEFDLDRTDVDVLLAALLPDVDRTFERLYGYLNDDVTQRHLTIELSLHLTRGDPRSVDDRSRYLGAAPLLAGGLIEIAVEGPFLGRSLTVPDRVVAHLLGSDEPDAALESVLVAPGEGWGGDGVAKALASGLRCLYVRGGASGGARAAAVDGARRSTRDVVAIDLRRVARHADPGPVAAAAVREARLRRGLLVAEPVDAVSADPSVLDILTAPAGPVVLAGRVRWDATWTERAPFTLTAPEPSAAERAAMWAQALPVEVAGTERLAGFALPPDGVAFAVGDALARAGVDQGDLTIAHLLEGARNHGGTGLERLARRIEPTVRLDDMVLRPEVRQLLADFIARARHRDTVIDDWGMRPGGGRGRGVTALLAGPPGTGKTMAAEAIAGELGFDLYVVDLSTVVDKYIGETEKNLERIFSESEEVSAVLLFDEADALFGKRTSISDAHDRYANLEISYLLQRMESFDGLALLASNLRANLDDALARRLDLAVDFPLPDEEERHLLWERSFGPTVPRTSGLDLRACARTFELAGGSIRAVTLSAAYRAAAGERAVTMADVLGSVAIEYAKLGRVMPPSPTGVEPSD